MNRMGMLSKFTDSPNFIKVLSFLLALLLWFFVAGDGQDTLGLEVRRTFSGIPLTYRNLGQDMTVIEMDESVTLSLQGVPQAFDGITPAHLEAYVDLNGRKEGRHQIRINATAPRGVSIVSIEPARANILLEDLITKQMTVEAILQGVPAGGLVVEDISFTPREVFIRGSRQKVDLIQRVVFRQDISNAGGNISGRARLYPLDRMGNSVQGITITPEEVEVEISLVMPTKEVPVEVALVNNGTLVERLVVEPSQVTVEGPADLLNGITSIFTEEIDLQTVDLEEREFVIIFDVPLVFPEGIFPVNDETVTVKIYTADEQE